MLGQTLATLVRRIRDTVGPQTGGMTDSQLLDRWVAGRDEAALEVLVWRHGPMVLGVCQRVLRHQQDAEDAFQATFLTLVKRANTIKKRESLGAWLHRVAYRASQTAREAAKHRTLGNDVLADFPAIPIKEGSVEFWQVLDEELSRLPGQYRQPFLLCCLQGRTHEEAARELNWPVGTVATRLRWARTRLAKNLTRRGLTLAAVALALTVPTKDLVAASVQAAVGHTPVPPRVQFLVRGVLNAMMLTRFQTAASVLLLIGFVVAGIGLIAQPWQVQGQEGSKPTSPASQKEADKTPKREPTSRERIKDHLVRQGGGNDKSEAAVAQGLEWVKRQQEEDGHWTVSGVSGSQANVAGTGLALLPFFGAGLTHQSKEDKEAAAVIDRGVKWLLKNQTKDGDFGSNFMYAHGLATMALCHAFGLTSDPALKEPAQRALDYIMAAQGDAGGWHDTPGGKDGDTSVTGWQIQALWIGQAAGLEVKKTALDKAGQWLDRVQTAQGGYGYAGPQSPTPSMTAAGLCCRLLLGHTQHPLNATLAILRQATPGKTSYHDYYACQAMFLSSPPDWRDWNTPHRDNLIAAQIKDDGQNPKDLIGSWPAKSDQYGLLTGPLYMTSLALLNLEVYYRNDLLLQAGPVIDLEKQTPAQLWDSLAASDLTSRRTFWAMARDSKRIIPFIKEKVRGVVPPTEAERKHIAQLVQALDSDTFTVREEATGELDKLGGKAEGALRKALEGQPSLEVRNRARKLLEKVEGQDTQERDRSQRAIALLELSGTAEAKQILEGLAEGQPDAWLTQRAKEGLKHLGTAVKPPK